MDSQAGIPHVVVQGLKADWLIPAPSQNAQVWNDMRDGNWLDLKEVEAWRL